MSPTASARALGQDAPSSSRRVGGALVGLLLIAALTSACGSSAPAQPAKPSSPTAAPNKPGGEAKTVSTPKQWSSPPAMQIDPNKQYTATIRTSLGEMKALLHAREAPNTVNNFVFLAREGFYDGVPFHRVIREFMVQTGDPTGTGMGGPGYRFADELNTPFSYEKGTLAMANAGPNTQGSQFFIVHGQQGTSLPKNYTIFGKVTDGTDTLDKIAGVAVQRGPSGENSKPVEMPRIESITIDET